MIDWHKKAEELSLQGKTSTEIANELNQNREAVRSHLKRWRKKSGISRNCKGQVNNTRAESVSYSSGVTTYEQEQRIINGEEITPELIMKAKGLDVNQWEVVSFTKNVWQQQTKDGQTIDLCQSKLSVRPKKDFCITFDMVDDWFKNKRYNAFESVSPLQYNASDEVLEIDYADMHIGLLSWRNETGSDFDLNIVREKFKQSITDIVNRCYGRKFKKIYFCALGDILHIDNDENKTTKGTLQQADGRMAKIYDYACETLIYAMNELLKLETPIEYIYTCGNHDRNTGYFLIKTVQATFNNNPNITFDVTPNPTKAIHFGKVLIGLTHGDMPKKNRGTWLQGDYRREFGESAFVEEHSGHIHTEQAIVINGIMCRSIPTLCGNSYWEHQMGYRSQRAVQSFVWNGNTGVREIWNYNI